MWLYMITKPNPLISGQNQLMQAQRLAARLILSSSLSFLQDYFRSLFILSFSLFCFSVWDYLLHLSRGFILNHYISDLMNEWIGTGLNFQEKKDKLTLPSASCPPPHSRCFKGKAPITQPTAVPLATSHGSYSSRNDNIQILRRK